MNRHPRPIEDLTNPFLASFGVMLLTVLCAIWMSYGYMVALITAMFVMVAIDNLPQSMRRRVLVVRREPVERDQRD